jgi:hypothetical protein
MTFKNKKVLIHDLGLAVDHAVRLAKDFEKVYYYTPWQTAFASFANYAIGEGMAPNMEKVFHFEDFIDKVDLICFFDVGQGSLANFLRKKGYNVYGAALGDKLEQERDKMRQIQESIGLPVQETKVVAGVTELRAYLKTHPNRYVKLNRFRGDIESFFAKDYESVEIIIDEIEAYWGPYQEEYKFVIEQAIDGIEPGYDAFFNGEDWIRPTAWGFENKIAYIGRYDQTLPKIMEDSMKRLQPVLKRLNYRGAISTEFRCPNINKGYLIDVTARYPFWLSLIFTESVVNYSELIWKCAAKEAVNLVPRAKYIACVPLMSTHAEKHWLRLMFDSKLRNKVKLLYSCKVGKHYYNVRGMRNGCLLITWGNNPEQMVDELKKLTDQVDAHELEKDGIGSLYKILEQIKQARKMGFNF